MPAPTLRLARVSLLAFAFATTSCSCGEPTCVLGQVKECYTGPAGTRGKGVCAGGVMRCTEEGTFGGLCDGQVLPLAGPETECNGLDDNCDGVVDEELRNACGGCAALAGAPGQQCGDCRILVCKGVDAVECLTPEQAALTPCTTDEGCPGTYQCEHDGRVRCAGPGKNECGLCGGQPVPGLGESCTTSEGCEGGKLVCSANKNGTVCAGPKKNNCNVCGQPDVPKVGFTCTAANGCQGNLSCDASGTGT